jgi:hypothetical protein
MNDLLGMRSGDGAVPIQPSNEKLREKSGFGTSGSQGEPRTLSPSFDQSGDGYNNFKLKYVLFARIMS